MLKRFVLSFYGLRIFTRILCLETLSNRIYFKLLYLTNFRPMHFLHEFCIILCSLLSLHSFRSLLILLKLKLSLFFKNASCKLTFEPLLILFRLSINVYLVHLSLLSELLRKFSLVLFIDFLMSEQLIPINRSVNFSFLLQFDLSSLELCDSNFLLVFFLKLLIHIFLLWQLMLMVPL